VNDRTVTLRWNHGLGIRAQYRLDKECPGDGCASTVNVDGGNTSYSFGGLVHGQVYNFTVRAIATGGVLSDYSTPSIVALGMYQAILFLSMVSLSNG